MFTPPPIFSLRFTVYRDYARFLDMYTAAAAPAIKITAITVTIMDRSPVLGATAAAASSAAVAVVVVAVVGVLPGVELSAFVTLIIATGENPPKSKVTVSPDTTPMILSTPFAVE